MPPAARLGDPTAHGGTIGPPRANAVAVASVLIGGKPAAVTGSQHLCPVPVHAVLSSGNVLLPGPPTSGVVLIGGIFAAIGALAGAVVALVLERLLNRP